MSLDKAIAHGKERRKPYYRGGRFDRTCRPGGSCPWCKGARLIGKRKIRLVGLLEDREPEENVVHSL